MGPETVIHPYTTEIGIFKKQINDVEDPTERYLRPLPHPWPRLGYRRRHDSDTSPSQSRAE